ncbi:MAG: nicotinate-nucleotide adenylyltransferase [Eubacteriales bacterium]|nr:nicotinate-nucleotide adenylyltransferase [Eubacteriales bacterium]MDD3349486.1 nicotinate-nucleotide adenylyltransferase [Eubacteriales bacterium]
MKKIGIIGGSFDPIHYGHLLLAEQARDAVGLDRVIFMPARISPFKLLKPPVEDKHRYAMVSLAIKENIGFNLSDIELKKEGASYTYETLKACRELYPKGTKIYFICGTDSFISLEQWYAAESIFKEFSLIVGARPRYKDKSRDLMIHKIESLYGTEIQKIHMPKIDISSTDIKQRAEEGRSIKYLLPPAVEDYIYKNDLYTRNV